MVSLELEPGAEDPALLLKEATQFLLMMNGEERRQIRDMENTKREREYGKRAVGKER